MAFSVKKASGSNKSTKNSGGSSSSRRNRTSSSGGSSNTTGSNSLAMAQQAVRKGYVKSVAEYNAAVSAGQSGAKYGYSNKGTKEKPNYVANTSAIGVKDIQENVTAPTLPTPAEIPDYTSTMTSNNTAMGADQTGFFDTKTTEITQPKVEQTPGESILSKFGLVAPEAPESAADAYLKAQKELGIKRKQELVSNYQSQLNAIVAKSQADQLAVTGQGRGIPEVIIGGQQAQIAKEAAIQALPIQAQLSAAQGDLEMAEKNLQTYYQIKSQDIQNQYNYKMKLFDVAYDIASKEQQNKIDLKRDEENFKRQKEMAYLNDDLARRREAAARAASAPDVKTINGVDMQWNAKTQTWDTIGDSSTNDQKSMDNLAFLQNTISDAKKLTSATGPNIITQGLGNIFVGNTKVKQLNTKLNTLKTNLLTLNTDPAIKKFFGPQMTENDTMLMMSAGTTMDAYTNSQEDLEAELDRYSDLLSRMQSAIGSYSGYKTVAPTGEEIIIID